MIVRLKSASGEDLIELATLGSTSHCSQNTGSSALPSALNTINLQHLLRARDQHLCNAQPRLQLLFARRDIRPLSHKLNRLLLRYQERASHARRPPTRQFPENADVPARAFHNRFHRQREVAYLQKHGFRVGGGEEGVDTEQVVTRFERGGVALGEGRPSSYAERGQITAVAEVAERKQQGG